MKLSEIEVAVQLAVPELCPQPLARVTLAEALVGLLARAGATHAFGVSGGAIAPIFRALGGGPLRLVHCRHEGGAAFSAAEASLATGNPAVVFATTGPGLLNTLTGLLAARADGARVILVSGATPAAVRGRFATQETSPATMLAGLLQEGALFDYAVALDSASELPQVHARIRSGLARPQGFVAHLNVPLPLQSAPVVHPSHRRVGVGPSPPSAGPPRYAEGPATPSRRARNGALTAAKCTDRVSAVARHCAQLLAAGPFAIWCGHGARSAGPAVRALVDRTGAPVIASPRGKGILPENHPLFVGVTGVGGYGEVERFLRAHRPQHILVLGSRLGEATSFWSPRLVPSRAFVHVDVDDRVFGVAYPHTETIGVRAEVHAFVDELIAAWPARAPRLIATLPPPPPVPPITPRSGGPVRPRALFAAVQRVVVDGSDATLLAESGNSFVWSTHLLRFRTPRYRVSTGVGAMGHAAAGVLGTALATGRKAVALVGDGAMLMQNELSTAVSYAAPAVWIVLNDALYGMVDQGMRSLGWPPHATALPPTDFAAIARAMGAVGVRVAREDQLVEALQRALATPGPVVVDVVLDTAEVPPATGRNTSLKRQAAWPTA